MPFHLSLNFSSDFSCQQKYLYSKHDPILLFYYSVFRVFLYAKIQLYFWLSEVLLIAMSEFHSSDLELYLFLGLVMTFLQIPDLGCPPLFRIPQAYLHPSCLVPQDQVDQVYLLILKGFQHTFRPLTFQILEVELHQELDQYCQVNLTTRLPNYSSRCQENHFSWHQPSPLRLFNYHHFFIGLF